MLSSSIKIGFKCVAVKFLRLGNKMEKLKELCA
jgi:hypothetical protein